jgi:3-oxoacyl-[acyl-carrier protein] reductase
MPDLVVTGGKGGLGAAVAAAFAAPGWRIAAPGRAELDVTNQSAVRDYFAHRRVDVLVCAAGVTGEALLPHLAESVWDRIMAVNFHGAADCATAVLPGMAGRRCGHIVFISSHAALHPPPGLAAYAAAKAALLGLTRTLAARHGRHGIRVNAVLPGFMDTGMTREVTAARRAAVLEEHSLGTLNTPTHAAGFIHFLHHHLPHTSGQVFQLDSRP